MKNLKHLVFIGFLLVFKSLSAQKINLEKSPLEASFVKIKGIDFKNGTIEVKVLSRIITNAPDWARGFIGLAFRIDDKNTKFERLRKESPELHETYADMRLK